MSKAVVFLSHIAVEAEVAISFKALIEKAFLGLIDVFVSSDSASLPMGEKWLETITANLKVCRVEVVLCSPQSVTRPWINFEAGAGWIRGVPVIPLCHAGMTPSNLPIPLKLLQAAQASDEDDLKRILPVLAAAIGATAPTVEFADFISVAKRFEEKSTFWDQCNASFEQINSVDARIVPALRRSGPVKIPLNDVQIAECQKASAFPVAKNILRFDARIGDCTMSPSGTNYDCAFQPLAEFSRVVSDPSFKVR